MIRGKAGVDGPTAAQIRRFAGFEADLTTGELRKRGLRVRLSEQPFQILAMLLERPGELVSREDLRQRLWPAHTFVDFDQGLNTAVNRLREVLGDSASDPKFVETLPKRGYRFIFPLEERAAGAEARMIEVAPAVAQTAKAAGRPTAAQENQELPRPARGVARIFFVLVQCLYLGIYISLLGNFRGAQFAIERVFGAGEVGALAALVTALIGIALRLYLFAAAAFDYRYLDRKFHRIFPGIFVLDELWALSPMLLGPRIGFGLALAGTAAMAWLPFAQRTLLRMAYGAAVRMPGE